MFFLSTSNALGNNISLLQNQYAATKPYLLRLSTWSYHLCILANCFGSGDFRRVPKVRIWPSTWDGYLHVSSPDNGSLFKWLAVTLMTSARGALPHTRAGMFYAEDAIWISNSIKSSLKSNHKSDTLIHFGLIAVKVHTNFKWARSFHLRRTHL